MSHPYSFRGFLRHLASKGDLAVIRENVNLVYELAAIAKKLDGRQATLFPKPGGHSVPVVSGIVARRSWIADAMGVPESGLLDRYRKAAAAPLAWTEVPRAKARCQEVEHRGVDPRTLFPIPTHSEHDSGPYISAGLVIARNPKTGVQNVSINRVQVTDGRRLGILMLPRHLNTYYAMAEEAGEPLHVAVVIGVDPLTLLASQAIAPIDHDELEIAGALRGAPLEVVKCVTSEVRVPADAEIVLEGRLLPKERAPEGPFGEFPRYYSARDDREVIEIDAITHRRNPIYHTIVPAEMEHLLLGAIPREATLLSHLQRSFPGVLDVHLSAGGTCRYHLVVKMKKRREGEPKNVIMGAFGGHFDVKQVIVVDEDVDIHDAKQVEWAVATRFQADRDLVVVAGAQGSALDPSTTVPFAGRAIPAEFQGMSAKMGLDATRPMHYDSLVFTVVRIPGEDAVDPAAVVNTGHGIALDKLFSD